MRSLLLSSTLTLVMLFSLPACSGNRAAQSAPGGGKGPPAQEGTVPADAGYDTAECVDLTDDYYCGGYYVLACCDSTTCAYIVTDGKTGAATFLCDGASCDSAADELAAYCGSGDTGYDTGSYDTGSTTWRR